MLKNLPVSLNVCLKDAIVGLSSAEMLVFSNDLRTGFSFEESLPFILAVGDCVSVKKL